MNIETEIDVFPGPKMRVSTSADGKRVINAEDLQKFFDRTGIEGVIGDDMELRDWHVQNILRIAEEDGQFTERGNDEKI